ncbi:MAG: serine/threonine protein kinase, partial [Planctomycetes bacterium]|nr:serine/threonine protein kinase [Planctomycetota bacterium]
HSASRTPHSALVKILDFGLANFASETAAGDVEDSHPAQRAPAADVLRQLTQMGTMMGTPDYIAPEQAEDAHAADIRADIYSLGCTFYTLLTGRAPFGEGSVLEKIKAHSEHDPPPLAESRNDVPPEVEHILMTMMAKDPAERYQSPAEVAEALRHFIDQRIEEKLHERRFDYAPPRKPTSAPATFITCGVIAAVLLCVLFLGLGAAAWFSYWSLERSDFHAGSNRPATLAAKAPSEADRMSLVQTFEAHQSPISSLAAAGDLLVSGAGDGKARVWSVKTGGVLHVLDGHQRERGVAVDINREATRVVTGDRAGRVWIWDLGKAKSIADVHAHDDGLYSVAFSPDGTKILSAGCDNTARVWGSATGEQLQVLRGHKWWVCDAAFSPDGRQAVTVSFDESARVWDIETGQEVLKLDAQNEPQFCVAWSRDGRYIANGLRNNLVRMYNAATGKEVRSFAGHADRVQDVAFSADDRWLFTGAYDRTLRVWNVETGEEVAQVSHGNHIFNTLAVLPDGRHIVSGGGLWKPVESENRWENEFDHAIRLWRLPEYLLPEAPESSAESAASGASAPADGDAAAPSGSRFVE